MRHEIISLQNAMSGNAESYPSCFQLTITGGTSSISQTTFMQSLSPNATIQLPGGYEKSDPGWTVDVYTNPEKLDYSTMFPGPPIPDQLNNGGSGGGSGRGRATTSTRLTATTTRTSSAVVSTMTTTASSTSTTSQVRLSKTGVRTSSVPKMPASAVAGSPQIITTTITRVRVMTMTLSGSTNSTQLPSNVDEKLFFRPGAGHGIGLGVGLENPTSPFVPSSATATNPCATTTPASPSSSTKMPMTNTAPTTRTSTITELFQPTGSSSALVPNTPTSTSVPSYHKKRQNNQGVSSGLRRRARPRPAAARLHH